MTRDERLMVSLSCVSWVMAIGGVASFLLGNPAALVMVVTGVITGTAFAAATHILRRRRGPAPLRTARRPDYDEIARLEEELGITQRPKPQPPVVRRVEIDGVSTEYRSWGA